MLAAIATTIDCVFGDTSKTVQDVRTNAVVTTKMASKQDKPFDIPPLLMHRMEITRNSMMTNY